MKAKTILFVQTLFLIVTTGNAQHIKQSLMGVKHTSGFEENKGQVADESGTVLQDVLFTLKQNGVTVYFHKQGLSYQWNTFTKSLPDDFSVSEASGKPDINQPSDELTQLVYRVDMMWDNANNHVQVSGLDEQDGYSNYYLPHCSAGVTKVKHYNKIKYTNLYPGIDVVYYINERGNLKYDIMMQANADASLISFDFTGASPNLENEKLKIVTPLGHLEEQAPVAWVADNKQEPIDVSFVKRKNGIGFKLPRIDKPIVLDPEIIWTTYYGGTASDDGKAVGVDASGNVFLSGTTTSTAMASSPGCITTKPAGGTQDLFITKLSSDGTTRLWATYYGGNAADNISDLVLDPSGDVVVSGWTRSNNLPLLLYDNQYKSGDDSFLAKFKSTGECDWATYYSTNDDDRGLAVATDNIGNIYLAGKTEAAISDINQSTLGFDKDYSNPQLGYRPDAYLVKFNSTGTTRLWATYYGGEYDEEAVALAVDENNNIYMAGQATTQSADQDANLTTSGSLIQVNTGSANNFIAKFKEDGERLWGTYFKGNINTIAVDPSGNLYVGGSASFISDFSTTGTFQETTGGGQDAYIAKLSSNGSTLLWASYFGGTLEDTGKSIAVDGNGHPFLLGETLSSDIAINGFDNTYSANYDVYIAMFTPDGSDIKWASYFGGNNNDFAESIAKDDEAIYITGRTATSGLSTAGAFQTNYAAGGADAFLSKILVPEIIDEDYPEVADKTASTPVSVTLNAIGSSTGKFWSKGITEEQAGWTSEDITPTGNTFTKTLNSSNLTDPLGLTYYFEITDNSGVRYLSSEGNTHLRYGNGLAIPALRFGNKVEDYQILSIPLSLDNPSVTTVFDELGTYDPKKWRLFAYYQNDNREFPGFSSVAPGLGYWLISKSNVSINTGPGRTVPATESDPFEISLTQGWNLIGNPYDFTIVWQDVLDANTQLTGNEQLVTFNSGTLAESATLGRFQGGFTFVNSATTIQIPVLKNNTSGGRTAKGSNNTLDEPAWVLPLHLTNGSLTNQLGGIGMHPDAKILKDEFDRTSMPFLQGMGFFELQVHNLEEGRPFTRDIVPTQDAYTWRVKIHKDDQGSLIMQWDNTKFGNNDKQLFLFNPLTQEAVNMRKKSTAHLGTETENIVIMYGDQAYIEEELKRETLTFAPAFPNPSIGKISIPMYIPESAWGMPVKISIFNAQGQLLSHVVDKSLPHGNHTFEWTATQTGLYLLRLTAGNKTTTQKIIIR
ncbi:MAG: T9SS type A sorting domain-containing protein [Cyclobacteriaceae bacterium]|nr:MAG: T9SS type A sorting domain-containing protein [Cyclobacteriaceae bacterium]